MKKIARVAFFGAFVTAARIKMQFKISHIKKKAQITRVGASGGRIFAHNGHHAIKSNKIFVY